MSDKLNIWYRRVETPRFQSAQMTPEQRESNMSLKFTAGDLTIHRLIEVETTFLPVHDVFAGLIPDLLAETGSGCAILVRSTRPTR